MRQEGNIMAKIFPFRALRPRQEVAPRVASVPYDVVDRHEARALADGNPLSFLHVTKPEIDLPDEVGPHDDRVYAAGAQALARLVAEGSLVQDDSERLYAYQLQMGTHVQTGIVLCASVDDYEHNVVRKHELTRPDKEDDRVRHMEALGAQSGTVFLAHRDSAAVAAVVTAVTSRQPWVAFEADDGVVHRVWDIAAEDEIRALVDGFAALGPIYIADGHHRSAAALRVAAKRRQHGAAAEAPWERFLAVSFPRSEVQILPYNRVVRDLGGHVGPVEFLRAVRERFVVRDGKPTAAPKRFGMFLAGKWYTLEASAGRGEQDDPVRRLDVSNLQEQLLAPLLGIGDPRRDHRIDFVGGIRGEAELERRVAAGSAVAFSLCATSVDDLFAIADAERVMPPKSTWFEPKLRDGLFAHKL
jgi:uncharacterized protein (DUF1015 family)